MKKLILIFFLGLTGVRLSAQSSLVKDLDHDGIKDSIFYKDRKIEVKLSTLVFESIKSLDLQGIYFQYATCSIKNDSVGFGFNVEYRGANMLTEQTNYFAYSLKEKKLRLIRMTLSIGGGGNEVDASADLLTGEFKAQWQDYYDAKDSAYTHEPLPIIRKKMQFPAIFLKDYDGTSFQEFETEADKVYEQE